MTIIIGNQKVITKYKVVIQKLAKTKKESDFRNITVYDENELIDINELNEIIKNTLINYAKKLERVKK